MQRTPTLTLMYIMRKEFSKLIGARYANSIPISHLLSRGRSAEMHIHTGAVLVPRLSDVLGIPLHKPSNAIGRFHGYLIYISLVYLAPLSERTCYSSSLLLSFPSLLLLPFPSPPLLLSIRPDRSKNRFSNSLSFLPRETLYQSGQGSRSGRAVALI